MDAEYVWCGEIGWVRDVKMSGGDYGGGND
jgi:hypothetical protein